MHGDCLEMMKDIPDGSVDIVLCDPPYGTIYCKWDNVISFAEMWKQYNRIVKEDGVVALFALQPFATKLIGSNLKRYRYSWYWIKNNKTGHMFAKLQPMRQVEEVCIFYKKHPTYLPQGLIELESAKVNRTRATQDSVYRVDKNDNVSVQKYTNYPSNVLQFDSDAKSGTGRLHPTQKPVDLLEYLVRTYTNPGETVLDNCMGSGSTGVACVNTGRNFIGVELDDNYFEIAEKRIGEALKNGTEVAE